MLTFYNHNPNPTLIFCVLKMLSACTSAAYIQVHFRLEFFMETKNITLIRYLRRKQMTIVMNGGLRVNLQVSCVTEFELTRIRCNLLFENLRHTGLLNK